MRSRHHFEVATWVVVGAVTTLKYHCGQERGRDMKLMSRHRLVSRRSRPGMDVTTWLRVGQEKRCRDPGLRSRPGLFWLGGKEVATWD